MFSGYGSFLVGSFILFVLDVFFGVEEYYVLFKKCVMFLRFEDVVDESVIYCLYFVMLFV